jgi:DNA-binding MarR family transcriptional regulator
MSSRPKDHIDAIRGQWQRERPELDTTALALFGRLFRCVHLADDALSRGLAEYDLQPGWFDILAALRRSGAPYELNAGELMRTTLLSSGGTTKRLDRLVEAGLVERRPDPQDRRGTRARLTPRGLDVIDRVVDVHVENEARLLAGLTRAEQRALDRLLRRLLAGLEAFRSGDAT